MKYEEIQNHPQIFNALIAYTIEQFQQLLVLFQDELEIYFQNYTLNGKKRKKKYVPRAPHQLPTPADKLFFILYYLKNNPTQQTLAFIFGLSQDMANKWIHLLTPILAKALKSFKPETNPYRLDSQLSENQEYIIDATERPIQRDSYVQQEYYSGKKKMHTIKNLFIIDCCLRIVFLSKTEPGKTHDKTLADKLNSDKKLRLKSDLGFYGYRHNKIKIDTPYKKPKGKELSENQKIENKVHNAQRVKVEHVLAHLKSFRILKDKIRNYKFGFNDLVMLLGVQLYNFKRALSSDFYFCS